MRRPTMRPLALVAAVATASAVLTPLAQSPAAAAPQYTEVVGLGDSYASGEGAGSYDAGTNDPLRPNTCHRSVFSWQRLAVVPNAVNEQPRQPLHKACSGAETVNVLSAAQGKAPAEPAQIGILDSRSPTHVFVSIGGNDLGFSGLIKSCIAPFQDCVANGKVTATRNLIPSVKLRVRAVLEAILAKSNATVVLAGYPQLLQGECSFFSKPEADALDLLSRQVRTAWVEQVMILRLRGENVRFADTIDPFKNHGACSSVPWINKILSTAPYYDEWMHPSSNGYQGYATAVTTVLRTDPMRCLLRGCAIRFQDESVYYSLTQPAPVAQVVKGSIRTAYEAEGAEQGWLGYPKTDERPEPSSGQSQVFEGGTYWWRSGAGAWPVKGRILAKYNAIDDVARIGTPLSKEIAVTGGVYQKFSSGTMYFKTGTSEAFYAKGAILTRYRWLGETAGLMGWPTIDEVCGLNWGGAAGCRQLYGGSGSSGSAIVYSPVVAGAFEIVGRVYEEFLRSGGPLGALGYPDGPQREQTEAPDDKYTVQVFSLGASIVVSWKQRTKCTYPPGGGVSCVRF